MPVDFIVRSRGVGLKGAADNAGVGGRADLCVYIVTVSDGALFALQAHRMHGRNVVVVTRFQAGLQGGCTIGAPSPYSSDVGTIATNSVEGAGKDAFLDGGGRCHTVANDAACVVALDVQRGSDVAFFNEVGALGIAHKACRVPVG